MRLPQFQEYLYSRRSCTVAFQTKGRNDLSSIQKALTSLNPGFVFQSPSMSSHKPIAFIPSHTSLPRHLLFLLPGRLPPLPPPLQPIPPKPLHLGDLPLDVGPKRTLHGKAFPGLPFCIRCAPSAPCTLEHLLFHTIIIGSFLFSPLAKL